MLVLTIKIKSFKDENICFSFAIQKHSNSLIMHTIKMSIKAFILFSELVQGSKIRIRWLKSMFVRWLLSLLGKLHFSVKDLLLFLQAKSTRARKKRCCLEFEWRKGGEEEEEKRLLHLLKSLPFRSDQVQDKLAHSLFI